MTEKNEHPEKVQFFDEKLYVASFVYTNVVITIWNNSGFLGFIFEYCRNYNSQHLHPFERGLIIGLLDVDLTYCYISTVVQSCRFCRFGLNIQE